MFQCQAILVGKILCFFTKIEICRLPDRGSCFTACSLAAFCLQLPATAWGFGSYTYHALGYDIPNPSWGKLLWTLELAPSLQRESRLTHPQHRLNWTIDLRTGTYKSQFPTPTGNPADPALTSHGVRQSHELAAHIAGPDFHPKPFRVYSSPFYRCLQTIQPSVEELKRKHKQAGSTGSSASESQIDRDAVFDVRIENGLG